MNKLEQNITGLFKKYTENQLIPGISAQVFHKGEIIAKTITGKTDFISGNELKEDSLFRIYSMTKVITVIAAMQLYEKGLFTLDTPLSDFIPSFKKMNIISHNNGQNPILTKAANPIRIKHLFTMTSGLGYGFYPDENYVDKYLTELLERYFEKIKDENSGYTTESFVNVLAQSALAFEPGSDFLYGYNHDILGRIIEIISGMPFGDYLKTNFFDPLEMNDTSFFANEYQINRLVPLYMINEQGSEPALVSEDNEMLSMLFKKDSFESGGGGLISSLSDYSKYCEVLLNEGRSGDKQLIGRKTLNLITQNHLNGKALDNFICEGYGYGLGVRTMMNPEKAGIPGSPGEYGWGGAAATWMCIDPKEEMYAVLMTQVLNCTYPVHKEFAQIIYGSLK